nr:NYN domain-containing protein [Ktedonobacterales bacterium]
PSTGRRYRFDQRAPVAEAESQPARAERISGWRATPPPLTTRMGMAPDATTAALAPSEEALAPTPTPTTQPAAQPTANPPEGLGPLLEHLGQPPTPQGNLADLGEPQRQAEEGPSPEALEHEDATTESEAATGRRRRRRRGRGHGTSTGEPEIEERPLRPEAAAARAPEATLDLPLPDPYAGARGAREAENGYMDPYAPEEEPYAPYLPGGHERGTPGWSMASAQQQMREPRSPFAPPEPAFARGFGPQTSGVAGPSRETYPRTSRPARGDRDVDVPPMSANQLGSVITGAIQRQTDRLLTELRHQQHPPSMTVMMPAYPSTERIGVFVDVANLLYSARSMRIAIDFGHLLEFLRGNRRMVRAHAYAPTNPDPNAEQAFLSAVKGLGYRITTKNYKTFSSGAKKADMDLDLCMDIVRLVDANALETVVLVSGDSDFLPLLEYCSDHGVRVEVAAFDDSAAAILRQSCDLFINLSLVDDIRG